jgi:hypothetical protein
MFKQDIQTELDRVLTKDTVAFVGLSLEIIEGRTLPTMTRMGALPAEWKSTFAQVLRHAADELEG